MVDPAQPRAVSSRRHPLFWGSGVTACFGLVWTGLTSVFPDLLPELAPWLIVLGGAGMIASGYMWLTEGRDWRFRVRRSAGYWSARDVIEYLSQETTWAWKTKHWSREEIEDGRRTIIRRNATLEAFAEFSNQAQLSGTPIRAFGVLNNIGAAQPIPHTFWMTNGLDVLATLARDSTSRTAPTKLTHSSDRYEHVQIEREGVEKTWPRMNLLRRIQTRLANRAEEREQAEVARVADAARREANARE